MHIYKSKACTKSNLMMSKLIASRLIRKNPCPNLLERCTSMAELKQIHAHMYRTCLVEDDLLLAKLVGACLELNPPDFGHARTVLDHMGRPSAYTCNAMIKAYSKASKLGNAVALFGEMLVRGVKPNHASFSAVSMACKSDVVLGSVHCQVYKHGFCCDVYVLNAVVHGYAQCGSCEFARKVFDEMPERDVISWSVVISSYIRCNDPQEAIALFLRMVDEEVEPDEVVVVAVLNACAEIGCLELGCKIEGLVCNRGLNRNTFVINSLIDMYAKCGNMTKAQYLFDNLADRNEVCWNTMIAAHARLGNMKYAKELFDQSPEKNVVSWSILINGYVQTGLFSEAVMVFHDMKSNGLRPNASLVTNAVKACGHLGSLSLGRKIHQNLDAWGIQIDVILGTALVDMYARCGCINISRTLFSSIEGKNDVSYNVMMMSLANQGKASDCIKLFSEMVRVDIRPNSITFVGILSGCAHAGWLEKGKEYYEKMQVVYNIAPRNEHVCCMVHLMGRTGLVDEAYKFIQTVPVNPDVPVWGALLNACGIHGRIALSEIATKKILELEPHHGGACSLLSNVYAMSNKWKEMMTIKKWMKERQAKNRPGWSRIEIGERVHEFLAGDLLHPEIRDIYVTLTELEQQTS